MTAVEAGGSPQPLPVAPATDSAPSCVEITFEYTLEEFREGLTLSPELVEQLRKRRKARPLVWVLVGFLVFVLVAALYIRATMPTPAPGTTPPAAPSGVDAISAIGPSAVAALFVMLFAFAVAVRMRAARQGRPGSRLATGVIFTALAMMMGFGPLLVLRPLPEQSGLTLSRNQFATMAIVPWIAVVAVVFMLNRWLTRTHLQHQWETKPYLRRRRTLALNGDGERLTDGVTDMFYRWPCFRRAWETDSCLVLLDENDLRHILPKRVMDQTTLEQARAVISTHVADCKFLTMPGGFPVAAPAPASAPAA